MFRYRNNKILIIKSASENEKEIEFFSPLWNIVVYDYEWNVTELQLGNENIVRSEILKWKIYSAVIMKRDRVHQR